ncbi:MAG: DUF421 domain-containing protein [Bacilli bacterium]
MEYFIVVLRTFIFYIIITLVYRFMGKREVGELGMVDFIVSILIAELAAMSIDKYDDSIWLSIFPIMFLVLLQIVLAKISLKNNKIRDLFDGKPSIIINRGKVNFKEMVKQRYNLDDLLTQLREKQIRSIEEVDYAILETSGRLSVFIKGKSTTYPLPIILDGKVEEEALMQIKKNGKWLRTMLLKENVKLNDIFYGFYKDDKLYVIKKKDLLQN